MCEFVEIRPETDQGTASTSGMTYERMPSNRPAEWMCVINAIIK